MATTRPAPPRPRGDVKGREPQGQRSHPGITRGVSGNPPKSGSNGSTQNEASARAQNLKGTELTSEKGEGQAQDVWKVAMTSAVEVDKKETETCAQTENRKNEPHHVLYKYGGTLNDQVQAAMKRGTNPNTKNQSGNSGQEMTKESTIDTAVATPSWSIAYKVDSANVEITLGAVAIEAGDRTTVVKEGGAMELANQSEKADVKVDMGDVTMKLGSDVTIHSVGGGVRLDALGSTTVDMEAGAMNVRVDDKGKLTVHGTDLEGEVSTASIHKGAVDIQIGKDAEIEIKGPLPSNLHEVKESEEDKDDSLTIRAENNRRVILEAGEDSNDEETTLADGIVTRGRQAYKILHEERLIFWKGLQRCQNRMCESRKLRMVTGDNIVVVDIRGRHDLPSCECVCRSCHKRMLPRKETYLAQGFWPLEPDRLNYLIDVELFRFYESMQACCKELSPQTFLQALGNFSQKSGRSKELSEAIFLKAFFEWKEKNSNHDDPVRPPGRPQDGSFAQRP